MYATVAEFVDFVGEAEARALAPAGAAYDDARLTSALEDCSATVDTYLAVKFPTPVSPVPRSVKTAVIVLAREQLDRQGRDAVKSAADRVRQWLRDVAKGVATIGGGTPGEDAPAPTPAAGVQHSAPARIFDDSGLSGFLEGGG